MATITVYDGDMGIIGTLAVEQSAEEVERLMDGESVHVLSEFGGEWTPADGHEGVEDWWRVADQWDVAR